MSKLYFRYGTVNSGKTMNLLAVAHNYRSQNKKVCIIKPKIDTRTQDRVYSRTGMEFNADIILDEKIDLVGLIQDKYKKTPNVNIKMDDKNPNKYDEVDIDCILVDEAQFLTTEMVMQLRIIATFMDVPVIAYGLKTNYLGKLFVGSDILLCVSDAIEEIKTTCHHCNKKAIMNLKLQDGKPITEGDGSIDLGFEDKYIPTCFKHYFTNS